MQMTLTAMPVYAAHIASEDAIESLGVVRVEIALSPLSLAVVHSLMGGEFRAGRPVKLAFVGRHYVCYVNDIVRTLFVPR